MRHHLFNLAQILLGLLIGCVGLGLFLAVLLPYWLAQYVSAVMVLAFLMCLTGMVTAALLLAGMTMQQREHDARIVKLLAMATRKQSGRA